ncbi:hypothetical protein [Methylotuvimicrobium alcaliphilum]|uniref:Uncharacterized protein n=1 Tax=Methylotuvimicrobium alcaliphilum (strain DSM 19304 / NCIMB 14124 / VKM B-2133 / 20Z) TaxID=1091494 RepID=G4SWG6_META2|nr:hypothetical protein [Methylotuvimicrobium alcaliphilum]PKM37028.1 MAG: hypothetical protein CVV06_07950 [Gammaproteobacteria bacterium HGW-Gammaproteobacteria-10]CCE24179.1 conserved protein of unknown function [Methylotuvimicrobium alcaliphilum 20Z]HBA66773.1 hypothetical protein [Methylococcaceae bacterium]
MENQTIEITSQAQSAFIEMLSAEFIAQTGVGVYAYLTPLAINSLFRQYLQHREPLRAFTKQYVKTVLV